MNARANRYYVALPTWTRTVPIILHEISHGLVEHIYGPDYLKTLEGHGAEFARVFIQLLTEYESIPKSWLLKSAKEYEVEVASEDILIYVKEELAG